MPVRNILVAYNGTDTAKNAISLAAGIAARRDAHLTGLYAHTMPSSYMQMGTYMPESVLDMLAKTEQEAEAKVTAEFKTLVEAEQPGLRTSFHCVDGIPNQVFAEFSRTHDLLVVGKTEGKMEFSYREPDPDSIALESGRPVMIAPAAYEKFTPTAGAVVAWDGRKAAARALSDAMEILEGREEITVLHVGDDDSAIRKPGRDIMEHLSRHGIKANLVVRPRSEGPIAETILTTCTETGAGLLVMGAYEHSKFSEMLIGGVTHDIVAKSPIPILMSH